jgi:transcriptional regulator with XRE-family HTH domain
MDDMIGVNIRFHREQRTWTQEHLAAVSGIDVRAIQRAERTKLSADSLQALAAAFDLTVDQLRKPPKPLADAADRFKMIRLNRIERAADLRNRLPTGACQFGYDGITNEAHEDAIAEFQRDLDDAGNLWSDLDPVQKLELLRSMEHHFTTLAGFGLIVAARGEPLRLRSEHVEKPFAIDVLHVVISKASEPKLFAMRFISLTSARPPSSCRSDAGAPPAWTD